MAWSHPRGTPSAGRGRRSAATLAPFSTSTAIPPRFWKDMPMEPDREQPPTEVERLRAEIEKLQAEATANPTSPTRHVER